MKIRNGFVSNSSSSSFIIAISNNIHKCKTCGNKEGIEIEDLINFITNTNDCDTEIEHYELTSEIFRRENKYLEEEEIKMIVDKINNKHDNERIMEINVGYNNKHIINILNNSTNIEIINKINE